ncbi:MAG TPA: anthranilate synthase component I [Caulobacterales bacterium]|nr:anthranilate synthase component I [Caulobacterales bacterium]
MIEFSPRRFDFDAAFAEGKPQLLWTKIISDLETPVSALLKLGAGAPGSFLLESVEGGDWRGRYSVIGMKPDLVWRVKDGRAEISKGKFGDLSFKSQKLAPIDALRRVIAESAIEIPRELPPMAAGLFGFLGYDMVRYVEKLPNPPKDHLGLPEALLTRPSVVAIFDNVAHEIILVTPVRPGREKDSGAAFAAGKARLETAIKALDKRAPAKPDAVAPPDPPETPTSNTEPGEYRAMVERGKSYARAGDIFQVVPSQRFSAPFPHAPFALYRALRRLNPSPFLFYLNFDDFAIVGSSPEILVRLRDGVVTVRPIAGTRPRGATPADDARLEEELLADPKERAEHLMLLDLGRNDVGRVARRGKGGNDPKTAGGVRVTQSFTVERYSHVMHIVSNVEGALAAEHDAIDALFAGFPAGTVSGAPKVRAMEIIDELEKSKRGVYAGGVGYFTANGEMDTCIALRTGVIKDGVLHVQAGGGVVLDSDPQLELEETQHKARALFRAAEEAWRFA